MTSHAPPRLRGVTLPERRRLRRLAAAAAVLLAAALTLAACAGEPRSAPADPAASDTAGAGPLPAEGPAQPAALGPLPSPPADTLVRRIRASVPDSVFVRPGACPFECCMYREWTAESEIPLLAAVRGTRQSTIPVGQRFLADSGRVHVTGVMVVAVEDSVGDPPYWSFARGDTLVVLDYVGEGRYNVWQRGRVLEAEGFWGVGAPVGQATTYGRWAAEWWVHATLPDGRRGWFLAAPEVRFAGADACGG